MSTIDTAELAATTNFVHRRLLEARAARDDGRDAEAIKNCREAAVAACRIMQNVFKPHLAEISAHMPPERTVKELRAIHNNRDAIRQFLNAEEHVLIEAGLNEGLVEAVIGRCLDFLDRDPQDINVRQLEGAFAAAEFRVCQDAIERLDNHQGQLDKGILRMYGRPVLNTAIGITIIAVDYKVFGPAEWFFSVSSGYGASWLPSGLPG